MNPASATRKRDAAATRLAILKSARRAFASAGYDAVGVREIAAGAGVTAMLVNRYFGSKEGLFAEVVADTMATPAVLTGAAFAALAPGQAIADALVSATVGEAPLEGFLIMLNSASNKRAAEISREQTELHHQLSAERIVKGQWPAERAAIALSLVAGFQVMRQMIGLSALTSADPEILARLLGSALTHLLEEPAGD